MELEFEALYYDERIRKVNPRGDVGVVTLWTKTDNVFAVLEETGIDVSVESSRIAVIANLYGNGLPHMLRNLLWNPQIRHLLIVGQNASGSREHLINFFELGLEEAEFLGSPAFRIKGTDRFLDGNVRPEHFGQEIRLCVLNKLSDADTPEKMRLFFVQLPDKVAPCDRIQPPELPEPTITRFPSNPIGQSFSRDTPSEAWSQLVHRVYRFGHRNTVSKSTGNEMRIELLNTCVVIENPVEESLETLEELGFSLGNFQAYQKRILDPVKPADQTYSYGNLLRGRLSSESVVIDSLAIIGERLRHKPDSRHEFASLWDNGKNLPEGKSCPCFVSAYFRRFDGRLCLTATFRVHNLMSAWLENVYGLIAIQRFVCEMADMVPGPITVISHSVTIAPDGLDKAALVAGTNTTARVRDTATGKLGPRFDPNGNFTVTVDKESGELVVQHSYRGMPLREYRGRTAAEVADALAASVAISDISHALYLGGELMRMELQLKQK